ncbi:hypothetical protein H5410_036315 [Solanum commersonii]|uniref:Endonuclease/exonuclease/phosphatase domain-containing protein n=1 Tax=Solanum commersonii TaxID=4109 RepID=A0A9J5Y376_SOLCO|nr:hypothetical protein H5410_036315 [Solanum commersonii]
MKLDQKRYLERHTGKGKSSNSNNNTIPKELKNLMFDMKFKDGEPRINVYILVETKLGRNIDRLIHSIWDNRWVGEIHLEADGSRGEIIILWDRRAWKGEMVEHGNQSITLYADYKRVERIELWGELYSAGGRCAGPWVVGGDFNNKWSNSEFSKCIEEMELVDPPLFGGSYTWRRGENHRSASRIDRFLYSSSWEEQFTLIKQAVLPKI